MCFCVCVCFFFFFFFFFRGPPAMLEGPMIDFCCPTVCMYGWICGCIDVYVCIDGCRLLVNKKGKALLL